MKKISNWSILGMITGLLIILISIVFTLIAFWRYYVLFPDLDRCVAYTVIGLLMISNGFFLIAVSWLYSKYLDLSNTLDAVEDYLVEEEK